MSIGKKNHIPIENQPHRPSTTVGNQAEGDVGRNGLALAIKDPPHRPSSPKRRGGPIPHHQRDQSSRRTFSVCIAADASTPRNVIPHQKICNWRTQLSRPRRCARGRARVVLTLEYCSWLCFCESPQALADIALTSMGCHSSHGSSELRLGRFVDGAHSLLVTTYMLFLRTCPRSLTMTIHWRGQRTSVFGKFAVATRLGSRTHFFLTLRA